ncbi:hypothetical protein TCAL_01169 [Tigriopus californicus]|uniref:Inositol polyphosphate-related phosphatase domain-containing protein n=1 Tax=Tigriopus californicus TaxID=6832 RepID=A0A553NY63_TIGCA|nr:inositol polyphosphate 5-phosphatase K-like [Tigriopus californicus]TRY70358.1 hypothetical protein TCAL_01169 [Tigriopus californicus]|eukprot:TCALIF_01169-PA protein Name:"Similar to Inpp5k Inositol polyphosphate 5-phosphatase K (Mus musculus)" AED:0.02 eAED:0.02 QI:161/1/1/1/0.33/0.75/4/122/434
MAADQLKILSLSFNVAKTMPSQDEAMRNQWKSMLGLLGQEPLPDLYAISLQEVSVVPYVYESLIKGNDAWMSIITNLLYHRGYIQLRYIRVLGTVLAVFGHTKHLLRLRHLDTTYLRVRNLGQKAAVAIRVQLYGVHYAFMGCHLTAHEWNLEKRIEDYDYIIENLLFPGGDEFANMLYHDYIIIMGDLNFRLKSQSLDHDEIVTYVDKGDFKPLVEQDSLLWVQDEGRAFQEFSEAPITFLPTFKFKIGHQEHDRKRRPGYTDRILYRANTYNLEDVARLDLVADEYQSVPEVTASDHKPVICSFTSRIIPPEVANRKALPAYKPIVDFDHVQDWKKGLNDLFVTYQVISGEGHYITDYDWVALFKADFQSLEDFEAFIWSSQQRRSQVKHVVAFGEEINVVSPGKYCLLYIGAKNCILGQSNNFHIIADVVF